MYQPKTPKASFLKRSKAMIYMVLLYLLDVVTVIAQHLFYSFANRREVDKFFVYHSSVITISTAMAFLFKSAMVSTIFVVFCQLSWFSFRRTAITMGDIDAIFAILQNPLKFFAAEVALHTPSLALLALISWLLLLSGSFFAIIFDRWVSPFTVIDQIVVIDSISTSTMQPSIPVLGPLDGAAGLYTLKLLGGDFQFEGPSVPFQRLAADVFRAGNIITWPSRAAQTVPIT